MGIDEPTVPPSVSRFRSILGDPPDALGSSILELAFPPYRQTIPAKSWRHVGALLRNPSAPPPGLVLVCKPQGVRPDKILATISWLRTRLPWLSVALRMVESGPPGEAISLSTRVARLGAIPIAQDTSAADIATAVARTFDGRLDLLRWLSAAVPMWHSRDRVNAADLF